MALAGWGLLSRLLQGRPSRQNLHCLTVGLPLPFAVVSPILLQAALYHDKFLQNSHPMPAILHITMGTNDTEPNAGWYDGYTFRQYKTTGLIPRQPPNSPGRTWLPSFPTESRRLPLESYLLLITGFGDFLFSVLRKAKAR